MNMRRRHQKYSTPTPTTALGSAIGDAYSKVNTLCLHTIRHMVPMCYRREQMVEALFPDNVRRIAKEAFSTIQHCSGYSTNYLIGPQLVHALNFEELHMAAPTEEAAAFDSSVMPRLHNELAEITALYNEWGIVTFVIDWLNTNATPGAIRYYWPTMLSLIPSSHQRYFPNEVPMTFKEPLNVASMIPLFRLAASTVAASQLMPRPTEHETTMFTLRFPAQELVENGVHFTRDTDHLTVGV